MGRPLPSETRTTIIDTILNQRLTETSGLRISELIEKQLHIKVSPKTCLTLRGEACELIARQTSAAAAQVQSKVLHSLDQINVDEMIVKLSSEFNRVYAQLTDGYHVGPKPTSLREEAQLRRDLIIIADTIAKFYPPVDKSNEIDSNGLDKPVTQIVNDLTEVLYMEHISKDMAKVGRVDKPEEKKRI